MKIRVHVYGTHDKSDPLRWQASASIHIDDESGSRAYRGWADFDTTDGPWSVGDKTGKERRYAEYALESKMARTREEAIANAVRQLLLPAPETAEAVRLTR